MDSHRSKHHIRMRSFCCNLAAAFAFIGLLFLTCAFVLYILTTTDPKVGKAFQELFEKATFESSSSSSSSSSSLPSLSSASSTLTSSSVNNSNRLAMFIASGIGAIGIALIIIAILFICVSCVSASECFNNRGCEFRARKATSQTSNKEKEILSKADGELVNNKQEQEVPLIARSPHFNRHIPVAIDEIENGSFEEGNRKSIIVPADYNQIGLPQSQNTHVNLSSGLTTSTGVWIPPNGFTYLKNPSDLENFYQESRASGRFKRIPQDESNKSISVNSQKRILL